MTMHLCKPHINNIGNHKKKPSAKLLRARHEHDQYLRKMGLHPDQLAAKPKSAPKKLASSVKADTSGPQCSNGFASGGFAKSVFDSKWKRTYEHDPVMAEREAIALAKAEAKKSRIMPLYNKGGLQFAGDLKMTDLGKRRP